MWSCCATASRRGPLTSQKKRFLVGVLTKCKIKTNVLDKNGKPVFLLTICCKKISKIVTLYVSVNKSSERSRL